MRAMKAQDTTTAAYHGGNPQPERLVRLRSAPPSPPTQFTRLERGYLGLVPFGVLHSPRLDAVVAPI